MSLPVNRKNLHTDQTRSQTDDYTLLPLTAMTIASYAQSLVLSVT
jgi:hypothetical protein